MKSRLWRKDRPVKAAVSVFFCLVALVFLTACANPTACLARQDSSKVVGATISPVLAKVAPDSKVQFTVDVAGKPAKGVTWLINGVAGGDETYGTIAGGLYHSPAVTPERNEVHVEARPAGGGRRLFSTVIVGPYDATYKLVKRWGAGGEGQASSAVESYGQKDAEFYGQFHGICLDLSGNIIVTDPANSRISRFTPDGKHLGEIGHGEGAKPGYFCGPREVRLDQKGRIYVIDSSELVQGVKVVVNRLQRLDPDGTVVVAKGKAEGGTDLSKPHSMDIGPSGRVYVADVYNKRVVVFDKDCEFLTAWPTPLIGEKKVCAPHGIGVDPNGDVFVNDYDGVCFKYSPDGELLSAFAHQDGGRYHAICSDRWGNVYFAARNPADTHAYIKKYNNSGALVLTWILDRDGYLGYPTCLFVGPDDTLYVTDEQGVDIFAPTSSRTAVEMRD